jgi:hypothetical protein
MSGKFGSTEWGRRNASRVHRVALARRGMTQANSLAPGLVRVVH